jgi:hypothetical protein
MKEQTKKVSLSLGKELTRNQQKKVLGGGTCNGCKCGNSTMSCTGSPISAGYCRMVWPSSGGSIVACTYTC